MTWAFLVDSVPFTKAVIAGETSLGGSESACLGLARALKRRGHDVHIFATKLARDAGGDDAEGVVWHPAEAFAATNPWIEWNVVVALRQCAWFGAAVQAGMRLLWNQDLVTPEAAAQVMSVAWALDHLVYVSEYHRAQWEDVEKTLKPLGWVTRNGYDVAHVPADVTKVPDRIVHVTRPERALRPILAMWPEIRKQNPNADLRLCRYASMYDGEGSNVRAMVEAFDREVDRVNRQVGGITWLGTLNKAQLYKEIAEAAVMWYPGVADFAETSCIAAVEAQACGTPFVGSFKGALPETVPGGVLISGNADQPEYQALSIAAVLEQMEGCRKQTFAYRKLQQAGREHVKGYTYNVLAAAWETQVEAWFTERYEGDKVRILRQLLHEDDHCAAKVVAQDILATEPPPTAGALPMPGTNAAGSIAMEAYQAAAFCDRVIAGLEQGAEDYAAHAIQDPLAEVKYSQRFHEVAKYFKGRKRVLDVACGNGAGAITIALAHPDIHVTGIDYAQANITSAIDAAARAGVGDRCTFWQGTVYDFNTQTMHADWMDFVDEVRDGQFEAFDALFVGEFVEHVADCTLLIDALEAVLEDGAAVVYTCPMGPFGSLVPRGQPIQRGHVHCFKHDDVRLVWGQKLNAGADFFLVGLTPRGVPIGHWLIHYDTSAGKPAGKRDLPRRAQLTRPFQRLTAGLITRDAANDLARCLTTIWPIVDEIIVGDTGSTDETIAIAQSFDARVLKLPPVQGDPQGFSGARNAVLDAATGDWFLWIDADELLMEGFALHRYLDGALFNGFVLRQTHLYTDMPPGYDIPVRVFRMGQGIRFYGAIHEQPQQGDANAEIFPALDPADVYIAHTGYLTERIRNEKRTQRNMPLLKLDQVAFPTRTLGKFMLLRETALQADAARAEHGLTDHAIRGFEHTIMLFDTYFKDPLHILHRHARPYYESALQGLGIGFEIELALGGRAGGLGDTHAKPERIWVRDASELEAALTAKMKPVRDRMNPAPLKTDPFPPAAAPSAEDLMRDTEPAMSGHA